MKTLQVLNAVELGVIRYSCSFSDGEEEECVALPGMRVWDLEYQKYDPVKDDLTAPTRDCFIGNKGGSVFRFDWDDFERNYQEGCIDLLDGTELKERYKQIIPAPFIATIKGRRSPDQLVVDDFFNLLDWSEKIIYKEICFGINTGDWTYAAWSIIGTIENDLTLRLTEGKARSPEHAKYLQSRIEELRILGERLSQIGHTQGDSEAEDNMPDTPRTAT